MGYLSACQLLLQTGFKRGGAFHRFIALRGQWLETMAEKKTQGGRRENPGRRGYGEKRWCVVEVGTMAEQRSVCEREEVEDESKAKREGEKERSLLISRDCEAKKEPMRSYI